MGPLEELGTGMLHGLIVSYGLGKLGKLAFKATGRDGGDGLGLGYGIGSIGGSTLAAITEPLPHYYAYPPQYATGFTLGSMAGGLVLGTEIALKEAASPYTDNLRTTLSRGLDLGRKKINGLRERISDKIGHGPRNPELVEYQQLI